MSDPMPAAGAPPGWRLRHLRRDVRAARRAGPRRAAVPGRAASAGGPPQPPGRPLLLAGAVARGHPGRGGGFPEPPAPGRRRSRRRRAARALRGAGPVLRRAAVGRGSRERAAVRAAERHVFVRRRHLPLLHDAALPAAADHRGGLRPLVVRDARHRRALPRRRGGLHLHRALSRRAAVPAEAGRPREGAAARDPGAGRPPRDLRRAPGGRHPVRRLQPRLQVRAAT